MTDYMISALTAKTTPASADLFVIVDSEDTSTPPAGAAGSDKKVTFANLAAAVLPDTAVTPGSYTSADITVGADGRLTAASDGSGGGGITVIAPSGDTTGATDAAAINAALAAGSPVFLLPSGAAASPYYINAPITPVTGSFITGFNWWSASNGDTYNPGSGDSGGALIIMASGFTGAAAIDMTNATGTQYYGVDISGITIEGNQLTTGTVHGILVDGAWGAGFLRGVCIHRPVTDCLHFATDSTSGYDPDDWYIEGCKFTSARNGYGMYADNAADSWFINCESSANQLDNWHIGGSTNARFTGCKAEESTAGAGWHFTGVYADGEIVSLTGCTSQYNYEDGFLFDGSGGTNVGTYQLTGCNSESDGQAGGTTYAAYRASGCKSVIRASGCYGAGAAYGASQVSTSAGMWFAGSYLAGGTAATHDDASNAAVVSYVQPAPGGSTNFLRADGTWAVPSGSGFSNPMTTLGDVIYENSSPAPARLAGNTTSTKKFFTQTGTGSVSAAPAWSTIASGDVPTLNQNTSGSSASCTGNAATATNLAGGATFPAYVAPTVTTLTDGSSVALNAALGNDFRWPLGASSHTLAAPSNPVNGQAITIAIKYSGSFTPLFNAVFDFGAAGQPSWSATSGKTDYAGFRYDSALNAAAGAWAYQGAVLGLTS